MKKNKPMFTLLTAAFNATPYIKDWANCIFAQDYRPLQVVCVDDSSTDKTFVRVRKLRKTFTKKGIEFDVVQLSRRSRYGRVLYRALQLSRSAYYGVLDIDDTISPDAVSHVMKLYMKYPNIGHIYTQFNVCSCDLKFLKKGFCRAPKKGRDILKEGFLHGEHVYSHFRTFSRRVPGYINVIPESGKYAVDQFMGMTLEERSRGLFTPKVCYNYRSGCDKTISAEFGSQRRRYWFKLMGQFRDRRKKDRVKIHSIESL